eukprot:314122_1
MVRNTSGLHVCGYSARDSFYHRRGEALFATMCWLQWSAICIGCDGELQLSLSNEVRVWGFLSPDEVIPMGIVGNLVICDPQCVIDRSFSRIACWNCSCLWLHIMAFTITLTMLQNGELVLHC